MSQSRVRYRIVCALVSFAFVGSLTSCASSERKREEAELRLQIGTSLINQGNYPAALRELLTAEKLDPKNEVVQNNLAIAYFAREKHELALEHLRRALEIKPSYSEARNNYGRVLTETAQYDEAIKQLEIVTKDLTYEDPAKALVNLGLAYFKKGDYRSAKAKLAEAVKYDRNHCLGQTLYGRSFLELGEYDTATRVLDNAVIICKATKFDEPFYYSGLSYYKLGRTSSAVARMEEVIRMNPEGQYAKKAQSLLKLMK